MILRVILVILVAALAWYLCVWLGLPAIVGLIAAILVLVAGASQHGVP